MIRKVIKKEARKNIRKNYWRCVAVVFFINVFIGSFTIISTNNSFSSIPFLNSINLDITKELAESFTKIKFNLMNIKPTRGILANLFNNITSSGSFIFGILNSLNQLIFHEHLWASIIIMLGAILTFCYWLFIRQPLIVGENRFFLENNNYKNTHFKRIFLPFKIKKLTSISLAMATKTIYEWLWWITIIGGVIKHYSYALVPYILAENPNIKAKEAIQLSEDMMANHKMELFLFDLSFIGWYILDFLTFHLLGVIYVLPYKKSCMIKYYFKYRALAQENHIKNINLLCDKELLNTGNTYPKEKFMYKETRRNWLTTDYNKKYSFTSLILMFFTASIIGWLWEVGFHLFHYGSFVNRGTMYGPWIPIYGWGLILLLVLLKKYRQDPFKTFILAMTLCGILEYFTSIYLEISKHARWWDYDGYLFNIQGRICLEGLLAFGIGGCVFIYFIAPALESIFVKMNQKIKIIICITLSILYLGDFLYSYKYPNSGNGITSDLKTTKIESLII